SNAESSRLCSQPVSRSDSSINATKLATISALTKRRRNRVASQCPVRAGAPRTDSTAPLSMYFSFPVPVDDTSILGACFAIAILLSVQSGGLRSAWLGRGLAADAATVWHYRVNCQRDDKCAAGSASAPWTNSQAKRQSKHFHRICPCAAAIHIILIQPPKDKLPRP